MPDLIVALHIAQWRHPIYHFPPDLTYILICSSFNISNMFKSLPDSVVLLEHYMGVSKNRGTPKWMVYNGNPIKMDDLGVPPFKETPKLCWEMAFFPVQPEKSPESFEALARRAVDPRDSFRMVVKVENNVDLQWFLKLLESLYKRIKELTQIVYSPNFYCRCSM